MKSDSVSVNVMLAIFINVVDENNNSLNISFDGLKVKIKASKNEQDTMYFERYLQNGLCQASCSFTLIQGESINCFATVPNGFNNYYPINTGNATLTWNTAHENMNLGGVYNWYPTITIKMKQG